MPVPANGSRSFEKVFSGCSPFVSYGPVNVDVF